MLTSCTRCRGSRRGTTGPWQIHGRVPRRGEIPVQDPDDLLTVPPHVVVGQVAVHETRWRRVQCGCGVDPPPCLVLQPTGQTWHDLADQHLVPPCTAGVAVRRCEQRLQRREIDAREGLEQGAAHLGFADCLGVSAGRAPTTWQRRDSLQLDDGAERDGYRERQVGGSRLVAQRGDPTQLGGGVTGTGDPDGTDPGSQHDVVELPVGGHAARARLSAHQHVAGERDQQVVVHRRHHAVGGSSSAACRRRS